MDTPELNDILSQSPSITKAEIELEDFIDLLQKVKDHPIEDVLPRLYSLREIDDYAKKSRLTIVTEILEIFSKKYYWRENGDKVDFNSLDLDYALLFEGTLQEFKKLIRSDISADMLDLFLVKIRDLKEEMCTREKCPDNHINK